MAALVSDRQKVVEILLGIQNLEIGYHNTLGCTSVHLAAKHGSPVTINSLLKRQRSLLSEIDNEGRTPLLVALQEDYYCTDISIDVLSIALELDPSSLKRKTRYQHPRKVCNPESPPPKASIHS